MKTSYYRDEDGNWTRREWQPQCSERITLGGKCQGVKGHEGDHWCYSPCGSYQYQHAVPVDNIAGGIIPPDHPRYVSPVTMAPFFYAAFHTDTDVTDPEIIKRLENDDPPEKGASITRPAEN